MPTLMITAVYEGESRDGLTAGRPLPGVPVEVGGLGREVLTGTTDDRGTLTVELSDVGSWTVAVTQEREGGSLLGLMRIEVAGPIAMLALPVRWRAG